MWTSSVFHHRLKRVTPSRKINRHDFPCIICFWEIGETVSRIINGLYPLQRIGGVQVIIMLIIVKDAATNVYYPRLESNFVSFGSGSPVAEEFITRNGLDRMMSIDEGRDHAFQAVWLAVHYDWFSGGIIRETIVVPGQMDTLLKWDQDPDYSNCANIYLGLYVV